MVSAVASGQRDSPVQIGTLAYISFLAGRTWSSFKQNQIISQPQLFLNISRSDDNAKVQASNK